MDEQLTKSKVVRIQKHNMKVKEVWKVLLERFDLKRIVLTEEVHLGGKC